MQRWRDKSKNELRQLEIDEFSEEAKDREK